jgi:hypothetical protein
MGPIHFESSHAFRRWRATSKSTTAPATAAFIDSTTDCIGIVIVAEHAAMTSEERP